MMKKLSFLIFLLLTSSTESVFANEYEGNLPPVEENLEVEIYRIFERNARNVWHLDVVDNVQDFSFSSNNALTVAVLDSGVTKVTDLECVNLVNEYNAISNEIGYGAASDTNGHGTKVALIIAGCKGGVFGEGVASGVNIMPIKVCYDNGLCSWTAIFYGILYAADNGADVINMSLGTKCSEPYPACSKPYIDWAINYALSKGVTIVASSGNSYNNIVGYPASHPSVFAVGAIDEARKTDSGFDKELTKVGFSNSGQALDFVAPGVVSTQIGNAVPVKLALEIGKHFSEIIKRFHN